MPNKMNQQKSTKTLAQKFLNYVNSLCVGMQYSPGSLPRRQSSPDKDRRSSIKPKRMTFLLDRALLKLSRKNLIVQEFAGEQALNAQIQDHLCTRLAGLGVVGFQGDFPEKTVKSVDYGIRIPNSPTTNYLSIQALLAATKLSKAKKAQGLHAMVFNKKGESLKLIEQTLASYFKKVYHFVFVIESQVQAIDYHGLFLIYRDYFLFEVERIMVINKCIANILYVSASSQFLNIENNTLAVFLAQEISNKDPFVQRADFTTLSLKLLNAGMHIQTVSVVGQLIATSTASHYDEEFVVRMKKRYLRSIPIIDGFLKELRAVLEEEGIKKLPQFHQNTPEFKNQEFQVQNMERELEQSMHQQKNMKNAVHLSFGMMMGLKGRGN